ncbi:MAG: hypothetical protein ABR564_02940 [Candidatus Dormibacteria bacterium]
MRKALIVLFVLAAALVAASTSAARPTACSDGIDNDHDGQVDLADTNCVDKFDDAESPRLSIHEARFATLRWPRRNFSSVSRRHITSCQRVNDTKFHCGVTFRQRGRFKYRASVAVFRRNVTTSSGQVFRDLLAFSGRWYKASCGSLSPRAQVFAIRSRNVPCLALRKELGNWYRHGDPIHSSCLLVPSPDRARCKNGKQSFSFRFIQR